MAAVKRMQQNIEASKNVGASTAAALADHKEKLKKIDEDINKVGSNLQRADLLLRQFVRKLVTDKIIMAFMLLIIIGAPARPVAEPTPRPAPSARALHALVLEPHACPHTLHTSRLHVRALLSLQACL